ncbi:MAG: hypothetical protein FWH38_03150, partial [Treponema sp.]|nr:hypothetical protein [Treponema sp.]
FYWTVQGFSMPTEISSGRNGLIARNRFSITPQGGASLGDLYSWTVPRIANIQTYSGELFSPITLVSPASGINIPGIQALRSPPLARWTTEEPLRNVQLIISRSSDPASDPRAIVMEARGATVSFPSLDEGIWYWIICGDTSDTRGATPREPFWINVLPVPLLPASRPIQPENNAVIDLAQLTRDRKITFSWSEVPAASAYIFSLFQDGNPPTLLFTLSPEMVFSYDLENLSILNDGNYLWQVEAVYRNNSGVIEQRGRIERHPFTIEIQRSANLQTHSQGTLYGQ